MSKESSVVQKLFQSKDSDRFFIGPIFDYEIHSIKEARRRLKTRWGLEFFDYQIFSSDSDSTPLESTDQYILIGDFVGGFTPELLISEYVNICFESFLEAKRLIAFQNVFDRKPSLDFSAELRQLVKKINKTNKLGLGQFYEPLEFHKSLFFFQVWFESSKKAFRRGSKGAGWSPENWLLRLWKDVDLRCLHRSEKQFSNNDLALLMIAHGVWLPSGTELTIEDITQDRNNNTIKSLSRVSTEKAMEMHRRIFTMRWQQLQDIMTQLGRIS